jgi:hypothetical protein
MNQIPTDHNLVEFGKMRYEIGVQQMLRMVSRKVSLSVTDILIVCPESIKCLMFCWPCIMGTSVNQHQLGTLSLACFY